MINDRSFLARQPLAVFGVSATGRGFGANAFRELNKLGIKAYALNPKGGSIYGQTIYSSLKDLPEPVHAAVILTKGHGAVCAVEEWSRQSLECVWLQGGSDTPEIQKLCSGLGLKVVHGSCILMRHGKFPHSLHRFFHDLFKKSESTHAL